tara:strand:+ start:376 stop:510 length:135 start_codon:yes stop_codon:yes gene_type:complete
MTQWDRDLPAIEKQKDAAFEAYMQAKLTDMTARIDAILLRAKSG